MSLTRQERIKRREFLLVLYALERKWGVSADLYKITSVTPNLELGRPGESVTKYHIPKFVTNSVSIDHRFAQEIQVLGNFSYGGIFNPNDRLCVIRNTFGLTSIDMKDYIIYGNKKYIIQQIVFLDYQLGWILHIRHTPGTQPHQIHDRAIWSRVTPSQNLERTL